jgi:DNA-binding MarR family transcriptional regulator
MRLWDRDGQTQVELVRALRLDPSTVARMVARLEEQGIVTRTESPTDRRAMNVSLTERGASMRSAVEQMWAHLEEATTSAVGDDSTERLITALERLAETLDGAPSAPDP